MLLIGSSRPIRISLLPARSKVCPSDSTTSLGAVAGAAGGAETAVAAGAATGAGAVELSADWGSSRSPHSSQKRDPSGLSCPCEQRTVIIHSSSSGSCQRARDLSGEHTTCLNARAACVSGMPIWLVQHLRQFARLVADVLDFLFRDRAA